jgi:hypothetical protein
MEAYLIIALPTAALGLLFVSRLTRQRTDPIRCTCGRLGVIYNHEQPCQVWCGRCWLRNENKL